jgi:threonine dehydrogenase-like Zn-dependent dehydrogenase
MKALTVVPGVRSSLRLREVAEPARRPGDLLVQALSIGICGTDRDIVGGHYGEAPSGAHHLVLGHESLGRVLEADPDGDIRPGDLVVGIVRRPDPVPCACCAAGEWDMCRNGLYVEHGIKGAQGYASERFTLDASFAVRVPQALAASGVLLEPASIVAKAWQQIDYVARRSPALALRRVLVTGAGPVGLLAALMGVQRGLSVQVLDRKTHGPKPELVRRLGASYTTALVRDVEPPPEIVVECTGDMRLVAGILDNTASDSVVCLAGISSGVRKIELSAAEFNNGLVLENDVVFGSVNANRGHYAAARDALERADPSWLAALITRRVPLDAFEHAFEREPDDVKVVLQFAA